MATIQWKRKAIKQLSKVARQYQPVITEAVTSLEDYQTNAQVKRLVNHHYEYRLRVGNYRVFFNVSHDEIEIEIVWVEEVKKRDESTY